MAIKCIVGLGNPGDDYLDTRHNIGFKFINSMTKISDSDVSKKVTLKSQIFELFIGGSKYICIKPQTFMNLSGQAVRSVMNFYKLELDEICVVTDDLDIPFGTVRVRKKGGAGTHNGMKSVIQELGSQNFMRLRLGIGPKPEYLDSKDFVLQRFSKQELDVLPETLSKIRDLYIKHINDPVDTLMNRMNGIQFNDIQSVNQ